MRLIFLFCTLLIMACGQNLEETVSFSPSAILSGAVDDEFARAQSGRQFMFPADHGGHPEYKNEWWYLTGNLISEDARMFAYQVTIFNVAIQPDSETSSAGSAWDSNRLWMAHAAITDVNEQVHIAVERFSRGNPGLAGVQLNPFKVWLEDWSLASVESESTGLSIEAGFPWLITVTDENFSLSLMISPEKELVLQGVEGLSQKSPEPGNASYYYSFTRLATEGEIKLGNESIPVTGLSWLDREWSSSALTEEQTGWDWFSLQFSDNQELMYYQLRDKDGLADNNSQGNWTNPDAVQTVINREDIQLKEIESWISPYGISYATVWEMQYGNNSWIIEAKVEDQLMDLTIKYWEGAVEVLDAETRESVGHGYLEMVRE